MCLFDDLPVYDRRRCGNDSMNSETLLYEVQLSVST